MFLTYTVKFLDAAGTPGTEEVLIDPVVTPHPDVAFFDWLFGAHEHWKGRTLVSYGRRGHQQTRVREMRVRGTDTPITRIDLPPVLPPAKRGGRTKGAKRAKR